MTSLDGNVTIIYNGEIYDYKALKNEAVLKWLRVSMANSLEVRVPFLEKEVIEFAFSLSEE